MKTDIAVVAGTFDPITLGHEALIKRAASVFSTVYVAIGTNPNKKTMFGEEDRFDMVSAAFKDYKNIIPVIHHGLISKLAKEKNAVIVKGLRFSSDFDYEHLQAESNYMINGVETVFLASHSEDTYVTSSLVKELIKDNSPFDKYVSKDVFDKISLYLKD